VKRLNDAAYRAGDKASHVAGRAPAASAARFTLERLVERLRCMHPHVWNHSIRVAALMQTLNEQAGQKEDRRETILAGLLHDIGKITIPPGLLDKGSALTPAEYATLEHHARAGAELLGALPGVPESVVDAALGHHERWNGSGYPYGLAGAETPRMARLCAVADVLDALTAPDRAYREPEPLEKAAEHISAAGGVLYDPAFARLLGEMPAERLRQAADLAHARHVAADILADLEREPCSAAR
jgi:putative nucleotidyltransferase with HDIG domain